MGFSANTQNINYFDEWSNAELNLRRANIAYKETTKNLVKKIIESYGMWPCEQEDSQFIIIEHDSGKSLVELLPMDDPQHSMMPFKVHHVENVDVSVADKDMK